MTIDGLTEEQCKMLDIMWNLDTSQELTTWFRSLPADKYQIALTLFEIMIQEAGEDEVKQDTNTAVKMLNQIGINCD